MCTTPVELNKGAGRLKPGSSDFFQIQKCSICSVPHAAGSCLNGNSALLAQDAVMGTTFISGSVLPQLKAEESSR